MKKVSESQGEKAAELFKEKVSEGIFVNPLKRKQNHECFKLESDKGRQSRKAKVTFTMEEFLAVKWLKIIIGD